MKTITIKPTRKGEREITSLTFAVPKVRHILATDRYPKDSVALEVALAASLTGEPEALLGELEAEDWVKVHTHVAQVYAAFVGVDVGAWAAEYLAKQKPAAEENPTTSTEQTKS